MAAAPYKLTLYSSVASQWANVPHLGLAEKGYSKDDYDIKEIDLLTAENFDPDYLKINPNGTVPSLTSPSFSRPLVDSTEILTYLDDSRPSGPKLSPADAETKRIVENLIGLVHSDDVGTNLILLQSRNKEELEAKRASPFKDFVGKRQEKLEEYKSKLPDHPFYGPKAQENGALNNLYVTDIGPDHQVFFEHTNDMYRKFPAGMDRLEPLIVHPYAAGDNVTLADLHMVPWLAHAMWGAGTTGILDFGPLERVIQKTVPDFKVGPKTREWWENMSKRDSFKQVRLTPSVSTPPQAVQPSQPLRRKQNQTFPRSTPTSLSPSPSASAAPPGWRLLSTYPDLQVKELKELLSERALPKTGRKDELVARLEEYDDQHPSTERKVGDDHKDALRRLPVPIGAVASEMGPKDEDLETRVVRGGPNGPPVYDEMGFELDYEKCARGSVMPSKKTMLNRMDRAIARHREEGAVKSRIMGMQGENLPLYVEWAWNDRVSRDLGIPHHKVRAEQFEEWERKAFRADPQDFENLGKEEEERLEFLTTGCALRK